MCYMLHLQFTAFTSCNFLRHLLNVLQRCLSLVLLIAVRKLAIKRGKAKHEDAIEQPRVLNGISKLLNGISQVLNGIISKFLQWVQLELGKGRVLSEWVRVRGVRVRVGLGLAKQKSCERCRKKRAKWGRVRSGAAVRPEGAAGPEGLAAAPRAPCPILPLFSTSECDFCSEGLHTL